MSSNRPKSTKEIFSRGRKKTINRWNNASQSMNENRSQNSAVNFSPDLKSTQKENALKETIKEQALQIKELEAENQRLKVANEKLLKYQVEQEEFMVKNKKGRFYNVAKSFQISFLKRSSKEELVARKIYQHESCFDNYLESIEKHRFFSNVPKLIVECVQVLENTPNYMQVPGLYRVSANYSQLQKVRFKIDQNNYKFVKEEKDPHFFTGLIKLFLRELKEPLILVKDFESHFAEFTDPLDFLTLPTSFQIKRVVSIVTALSPIPRDTIQYFMKHLNKVLLIEENQMDAHSLSIVIGACIFYELMADLNMTDNFLKCTVPNFCIELMITNYSDIFEVV